MPDPVPSLSAGSWRRVAERLESEKVGVERELAECKEALEAIAKSDCYCHGGDEGSVCDTCIARSVVDRGVS